MLAKCRVGFSGGNAQLQLRGLSASSSSSLTAASFIVDVDGQPASILGFDNDLLSLTLPARPPENRVVETWARVSERGDVSAFALVRVQYAPAPRLVSAKFASDGGDIFVRVRSQSPPFSRVLKAPFRACEDPCSCTSNPIPFVRVRPFVLGRESTLSHA